MRRPRKGRSELDQIADAHARIAAQATALASLEREITNNLERSPLFSILVADTVIAEKYTDPAACLAWLTASHRSWLRSNEQFNRSAERLVFYRYILLPYPSLLRNWHKRQVLREIILLHLHLQLWHGVICGVLFIDPRQSDISRILQNLNFAAIPSHRLFFDTPAFYSGDGLKTSILSGSHADKWTERITRILVPDRRNRPIWLHYDESNFSDKRLGGWRWDSFRQFFKLLYGPRIFCAGCHHPISNWELDHIAPFADAFPQTLINFRPLCSSCNREKGSQVGEDPFRLRLLLPSELRTNDLDDILRLPPPWLGKLATPASVRELTRNTLTS